MPQEDSAVLYGEMFKSYLTTFEDLELVVMRFLRTGRDEKSCEVAVPKACYQSTSLLRHFGKKGFAGYSVWETLQAVRCSETPSTCYCMGSSQHTFSKCLMSVCHVLGAVLGGRDMC